MNRTEKNNYCLEKLLKAGADKAACLLSLSEVKELNVEIGEMTLFRTTFNSGMSISVIKDNKKGSTYINKTDKDSIDNAVVKVMELCDSSQPDEAYDIASNQPKQTFLKGNKSPNMDLMYESLKEFVDYVKSKYPQVQLEQAIIDFTYSQSLFQNTNGVNFDISEGIYGFSPMFLSKEGNKISSFNGTGFSSKSIDKPLHKYGSIDTLLSQSIEQLNTQNIQNKFVGTILVTPDSISDFLSFITNDISDGKMISGNSIYKDKLNKKITNSKLTLHSCPNSNKIEDGYFITRDGYVAENATIIDKGILMTHLLGVYGSNKLGQNRSVNDGGAYIIDPGNKHHSELIKNIDQGILLSRFSGGSPANNGDFSGVAKNSYYIENGLLKYPISETMVSGNISTMFHNLEDISSDRINFGSGIFPWVSFNGLTIS